MFPDEPSHGQQLFRVDSHSKHVIKAFVFAFAMTDWLNHFETIRPMQELTSASGRKESQY